MDISTIVGAVLGIGLLLTGFVMEGGHIHSLILPSPAVIVFGGTGGALVVSFSFSQLARIPKAVGMAMAADSLDPVKLQDQFVKLAEVARREGLLALEETMESNKELPEIVRKGMQMIIDGMDPELVRNILETELYVEEEYLKMDASIFEAAGGYSPTMGVIGTVMGLVHVLGNLSEPDKLGPSIAAAFVATLYGVAFANLIYLPMGGKLKGKGKMKKLTTEMAIEGVLSIQAGESPMIIKQKLGSFIVDHKPAKGGDAEAEEK